MLLCPVPGFGCLLPAHQPWRSPHRWNAWSDANPINLSQLLHSNRIISLLFINHVSKLYSILRTAQDSSSLTFAEAFKIQPVENVQYYQSSMLQTSPGLSFVTFVDIFLGKQGKNGCTKSEIKAQHIVVQLKTKESPFDQWNNGFLLTPSKLSCLCMQLGHHWSLHSCCWIQICSCHLYTSSLWCQPLACQKVLKPLKSLFYLTDIAKHVFC